MTASHDIYKTFETHDSNLTQLSEAIVKSGGEPHKFITPEIRKFFFGLACRGILVAADCKGPVLQERVIKRRKPRNDAGKPRGKLVRANGDKPAQVATDD